MLQEEVWGINGDLSDDYQEADSQETKTKMQPYLMAVSIDQACFCALFQKMRY